MFKKLKTTVYVFLLSGSSIVHAQSDSTILNHHIKALQQYAENYPIEKVHLHLDRPWYGLGDTIWFKAYTVTGEFHRPSKLSGVLYAELINGHDSVSKRLIIPLNSGIGKGDFVIPYTYKSGMYRLRAYTNWMRNDSSYFFDRKIIIGGIPSAPDMALNKQVTSTNNNSAQSIAANPDVQFFPEGGYLVNGLRSKIAFKAINKDGLSIAVQGVVIDNDNNEVASFNTGHAGMGQFPLTPQKGKKYQAKITCADGNYFTVDLREAKNEGFTLTINNAADSLYIKIAASENLYKSKQDTAFYLIAQSGGKYYFATAGKLENQVYTTKIPAARFPTGIVQFTLFSQSGEPLNERVVFVQNSEQLKLKISAERESYAPLEKVQLAITAADENAKAVAGSFSVSVTDETKVPVDEQSENTILTDLLLTSELKGHIENPNYYFTDENEQTREGLDLLMLTQSYSRFEWKKILSESNPEITFKPETALSLSGNIKTFSKKPIPGGKIRLTSIKDFFVADTVSGADGNFIFTNLDFSDTTKVVVNAKKAKGGDNVIISIKEPVYPAVNQTENNALAALGDSLDAPVLNALKKSYVTGQQDYFKNVHQLKEVEIKSRRNTYFNPIYADNMQWSANLNGPGNANEVILGDDLISGGGGLLSEILPIKLPTLMFKNGIPHSLRATHVSGDGAMAVFVEGAQVSPNELDFLNPNDIYSIEVLTSVSYLSIYGSNAPNGALIITLRHGSGYNPENGPVNGLITYKFKGFYKAREFYSPKYITKNTARITDDRKTIYWDPDIITGKDGKASVEFYNSGSKGVYRVVVEGIDGFGNLGRQVFRYRVE